MKGCIYNIVFFILLLPAAGYSQCQNYTVFIQIESGCTSAIQVSWQLIGSNGTLWLSGGAPFNQVICLPDDCYTLYMLDTGGDGWDCVDWFIEDLIGVFDFDTNLPNGNFGTDQFELGTGDCAGGGGGGGGNCPIGTLPFNLTVTDGDFPDDVSWSLTLGGATVVSGLAGYSETICLDNGCYVFEMADAGGDGWDNAEYFLEDDNGNLLSTGTLASGSSGFEVFNIGGLDCSGVTPGGGGGGGGNPGAGCGSLAPSSDCNTAPCVCDNYAFQITPSGSGTFIDVPGPGSISNPNYGNSPPWGGTDWGCLLAGELNSFWMVFSIGTSGVLQFSLGQNSNGGQFGFYDWALWPYNGVSTCSQISDNTLPPVRCTWNATTIGGTGLAAPIPAGGNAGNYGPPLNVTAGQQYILCMSNWSYATANVVLDFFGTATIQCASILPVEFISLDATQIGQEVLVEWRTSSEINSDYFSVQRSKDGYDWETIGRVGASGTSHTEKQYNYVDHQPLSTISYYRIEEFDMNGLSKITDVVDIYMKENGISAYPNPANTVCNLRGVQHSLLSVYSASGSLVWQYSSGENYVVQVPIENWANGSYAMVVVGENKTTFVKILVQHN